MKRSGISLVELLVALAVLATLLTLAMPEFSAWTRRTHTENTRTVLARLVNTARHAAINLNRPIVLCPGDATGCGSRDTWHRGAVAFADDDLDQVRDTAEPSIAQVPAFKHSTILWRAFRNRGYLKFMPTGYTDWQNGHFLICADDRDPALARQLVLNAAGRLYYSRDSNGDGVHEDVRGKPLDCGD